jgi:signal transduction histidine kinase
MADPSPKALDHIKSIRTIIDSIFDDTYRMISDLRPSILDDLGLEAAVSWFAEERLSPAGINFQFKRENLECRLTPVIETTLFRIFQEAITNIVCHSKASFVDIFLSRGHDLAVLIVSDNGQGFDPSILKTRPSSCYGLTGISERVNSLDGKLQIISSTNNGTTLEISIPIQKGR